MWLGVDSGKLYNGMDTFAYQVLTFLAGIRSRSSKRLNTFAYQMLALVLFFLFFKRSVCIRFQTSAFTGTYESQTHVPVASIF